MYKANVGRGFCYYYSKGRDLNFLFLKKIKKFHKQYKNKKSQLYGE